jgi:hypothetical protein
MCWVADAPPTASREPAAWREPEEDIEVRELCPGDAKYEEFEETLVEVRNPIVVRADISAGLKAVPGTEVEVGLASITEMYFSG